MNYIKTLQTDNESLRSVVARNREVVHDLRGYLLSPKFRCGSELDGYVNINDVLRYLERIENET